MFRFLIIQTAFTGDVVLATAIAEKLHAHYPGAQIDFLLRKKLDQRTERRLLVHNLLVSAAFGANMLPPWRKSIGFLEVSGCYVRRPDNCIVESKKNGQQLR